MDKLSKGWSFMRAAFQMAGQQRKLLAPSVYQVLVSLVYFVAWVAALVAIDPHWSRGTWAVVGGIATFGSFLIFYFFCGMTVNMIDVHLKGGKPSLGEGARDASKNFLAIVFLATVSTVIGKYRTPPETFSSWASESSSETFTSTLSGFSTELPLRLTFMGFLLLVMSLVPSSTADQDVGQLDF